MDSGLRKHTSGSRATDPANVAVPPLQRSAASSANRKPRAANGLRSAYQLRADSEAMSIVHDDDGRPVVTATRNNALAELRLLPNVELDPSFGVDGVFAGPTQLG
jgi:hypothetical protein